MRGTRVDHIFWTKMNRVPLEYRFPKYQSCADPRKDDEDVREIRLNARFTATTPRQPSKFNTLSSSTYQPFCLV